MARSFKLPSSMSHDFSVVPRTNLPRSVFPVKTSHKSTFDEGYLIPLLCEEVLPGDTWNLRATFVIRMAPTGIKVPVMDNLWFSTFWYFTPNRLVMEKWQRLMGERIPDPDSSIDFLTPLVTVPTEGFASKSLYDYLGYPVLTPITAMNPDAYAPMNLPARVYNLIWNEDMRDENIQDSVVVDLDEGPDDPDDYILLKRGKRYDYFTSSLPEPQKGPAVELPLGDLAPVIPTPGLTQPYPRMQWGNETGGDNPFIVSNASDAVRMGAANATGANQFAIWDDPGLSADLSNATAATVNSIREAVALQQFLERDARGGTRYIELLLSHFGVVSPDARLQRPEFLGGKRAPIFITPVEQTSATPVSGTAQGNLAASGHSVAPDSVTKSMVEHGWLMLLGCIHADLSYSQGIPRKYTRRSRYDYFWPDFAHLGEQAVLQQEIFASGTDDDAIVFGYQERYAEYRHIPPMLTGLMRPAVPNSVAVWNFSQEFEDAPTLSPEFIEEAPPVDRVVAFPNEPHFFLDSDIQGKVVRSGMPVYSVPGLKRF